MVETNRQLGSLGFNPFLTVSLAGNTGARKNIEALPTGMPFIQSDDHFNEDAFSTSALDFSRPIQLADQVVEITNNSVQESIVPQDEGTTSTDKKVLIIDNFQPARDGSIHGENVYSIVSDHVDSEDILVADFTDPQYQQIDLSIEARDPLDSIIEKQLTSVVDSNTDVLRSNLETYSGELGVVTVSSGYSKIDIVQKILDKGTENPQFVKKVKQELNLPDSAGTEEVVTALIDRVEAVSQTNPVFQESQANYQAVINEGLAQGITFTRSAGNDQAMIDTIASLSTKDLPPDFAVQLTNAEGVLLVGATDDMNTADLADDQAAAFSSRSGQVDIASDGVNTHGIEGLDGTSFSTPDAAGVIFKIQEASNWTLTPEQVELILKETATNEAEISSDVVGVGVINEAAAVAVARLYGEQQAVA